MRLSGEVAVVTGSTSGLGREIARRFAAEGAAVVVTGRNGERGRAGGDAIVDDGGRATFVAADLAVEDECAALVAAAVDAFGALTVLVNNAVADPDGGADGAVHDVSTARFEHALRVNVLAVAWLCRAAVPAMQAAGHGAIVNISSVVAWRGTPGLAAYTASKGALAALTRSMAVDLAPLGIRCNTITPGYIINDRRDADLSDDRRAHIEARHLTRLGLAADVAAAAAYLASAEAGFVTGADLAVDGGVSAARPRTVR